MNDTNIGAGTPIVTLETFNRCAAAANVNDAM